jgi:hypothetical protein
MSEPAYFTVDQIGAAADHVIAELQDDPDSVIALPIPNGITVRERADLLNHHGRCRGRDPQARLASQDARPPHAGRIGVRDRPSAVVRSFVFPYQLRLLAEVLRPHQLRDPSARVFSVVAWRHA